jgi:3',5'-cyclic AMP phosphodiesterase CpdA
VSDGRPLRLAFTADLHWGSRAAGDAATRELVAALWEQPPDVLVLGGDVGASRHFGACLALFDGLPCRKALVPGNHDVWVNPQYDDRGDSLDVYRAHLPRVCAEHDFHYLDQAPLYLLESGLALVGSMNWYDYSWSLDRLRDRLPDWEERLRTKRFSRGRHNDANFVRWPLDDVQFTEQAVQQLELHLVEALRHASQSIVVTHHPPFYGLNFPERDDGPPTDDRLLWEAFSGNRALETVLQRWADRIPFAFCGHTHRERENMLGPIRGYNIGGDYHFKRLLLLDWPAGSVKARVFHDPAGDQ